jgi:hypothetical protein
MTLQTRKLRTSMDQRRRTAKVLISPEGLLAPINRKAPSKRTVELIELLRTVQKIDRWIAVDAYVDWQLSQEPNYGPAGPTPAPRELYVRANEILSKYHWSPRVGRPADMSFSWSGRTEQSDWENRFVYWIFNLLRNGELTRLKSCRDCGKWFYAVTNHQGYCNNRCRQHQHAANQGFKEKRRLYMKRYRQLQKRLSGVKSGDPSVTGMANAKATREKARAD